MLKKTFLRGAILAAAGTAALNIPAALADHGPGRDRGYGGPGGIVLHADSGFSGESLRIDRAEPDLSRYRFNDRVSSITLHGGVWEVCTDADFRGRCEIVDRSAGQLNAYRLNDNISSVRPAGHRGGRGHDDDGWGRPGRGGGHSARLVLFSDSFQRGPSIEIGQDVPDLSDYRFNDRASSFLVAGGTWQVCEHANYRGRCEILSGGTGELKPVRMNDNISSIRRYGGRW